MKTNMRCTCTSVSVSGKWVPWGHVWVVTLTGYTLYNSRIEGAGLQRVSHCGLLGVSNKLAARLMFVFVGLGKRFRLHYSARNWSPYCHYEQLAVCQGMCAPSLIHTHTHAHFSFFIPPSNPPFLFCIQSMLLTFCNPFSHLAFESLLNIQRWKWL